MIGISVRVERLYNSLPSVGREQLPFGVALGLNQTGKDIQATQKRGIQQRMTLRRASWVLGLVNIRADDWATKRSLVQRVRVGADEPQAKRRFSSLFARHEHGGVDQGDQWIPTAALRPAFSTLVPQRMRPWSLGLWRTDRQIGAGTAGSAQRRGKQRTFSIISKQGELVGIYQRYGLTIRTIKRRVKQGNAPSAAERLDEGIRLIWRHERSIRLRPRLGFGDTARLIARTKLGANVEAGLIRALRTARPNIAAR